jgi:glycosyltransferase involved in cell wall biosynthesis
VQTDSTPPSARTHASWAGYETEADAGKRYSSLINQLAVERASVLIVASVPHPLARELQKAGCDLTYCSPQRLSQQEGQYDCIVLLSTLERFADPGLAMRVAFELLKDNGLLFLTTPSLDSFAAKFFGRSWVHWSSAHRTYFNRSTLQLLMERHGFKNIWFETDRRLFSIEHLVSRLQDSKLHALGKIVSSARWLMGERYFRPMLRCSTSGIVAMATKSVVKQPTLSIIMPVYNEKSTVAIAISSVIAKSIPGVEEREIIVVESNSSDGTREIVEKFADAPGVKLVFEEKPRGKGHAVRTGLKHASGDIILIQDADTEYDINDYDQLLAPLLRRHELFVLGSRHQGDWKMRRFNDNPMLAGFFNLGQILFTWLMNTLYGQRMTDPFTMYKVFRRECLFGLNLECNRFDFDHELVIKLIRKGYRPHEIPVNYVSRTYSEGKKVTVIGDPLSWIKADFKYRFVSPLQKYSDAYAGFRRRRRTAQAALSSNSHSARTTLSNFGEGL